MRSFSSEASATSGLSFELTEEQRGFQELARATTSATPVWALGGLRPEDVAEARAAGAAGVAALGGVLGAADPAAATTAYLEALA